MTVHTPKPAKTTTSTFTFQLPALQLQHTPLTDGTDIPPPLPSPPLPATKPLSLPATTMLSVYPQSPSPTAISPASTAAAVPAPPATRPTTVPTTVTTTVTATATATNASKRASSVLRLLSLRALSPLNRSSESLPVARAESPPPSSLVSRPSLRRKRSSLLFGVGRARKRSGGLEAVGESAPEDGKAGDERSAAPRLPELVGLEGAEVVGGGLGGGEMFRDIK